MFLNYLIHGKVHDIEELISATTAEMLEAEKGEHQQKQHNLKH